MILINIQEIEKKDLSILKKLKVNYVYLPSAKEIYRVKRSSKIIIPKKDKILCAKHRKGHFEGVLAVMNQLLKLIKAKYLFLGLKDFQQLYLIKKFINRITFFKFYECFFIDRTVSY